MFLILRDPGMVSATFGLRRRYERLLLICLERFRVNNHHPFLITTYLPQVSLLSIKVDCYKNEDPPNSQMYGLLSTMNPRQDTPWLLRVPPEFRGCWGHIATVPRSSGVCRARPAAGY